ncbi:MULTISPECIES: hypothetical protein [Natrialbaceae]|uniref:hypothetical protein n=1 Tax=Natrialbaceae TaxID=1644061 RepID=UPI00207CD27A|nr:hypothetical protein [Natronococcus sp. CG52]
MTGSHDSSRLSRRVLLQATGGTIALSSAGIAGASGTDDSSGRLSRRCPDATLQPSMGHCEGASVEGCADDHPATVALREEVQETLETRYPDVGALIDAGFKPYFDTLDGEDDGWSHWLNPEYIGDDTLLDPERPESVLVDNQSWRSIGVMFIATRDGEPIDPPPAVYDADGDSESPDDGHEHDRDPDDDHDHENGHGHDQDDDHHDYPEGDPDRCSPWHYHAGLPGRFAWWYYQQAYEGAFREGDLQLPCRTPCLMHVWAVDHPGGAYAHDGPPAASRDDEPAEDPGFEDAEPGEDELGWDVLPDEVAPDRKPDEFSIPGRPGP